MIMNQFKLFWLFELLSAVIKLSTADYHQFLRKYFIIHFITPDYTMDRRRILTVKELLCFWGLII